MSEWAELIGGCPHCGGRARVLLKQVMQNDSSETEVDVLKCADDNCGWWAEA